MSDVNNTQAYFDASAAMRQALQREIDASYPPVIDASETFGGCPDCGMCDGILNFRSAHWAVCHEHERAWNIGSNLFSSWKNEDFEAWEENRRLIESYEIVVPVYPVQDNLTM